MQSRGPLDASREKRIDRERLERSGPRGGGRIVPLLREQVGRESADRELGAGAEGRERARKLRHASDHGHTVESGSDAEGELFEMGDDGPSRSRDSLALLGRRGPDHRCGDSGLWRSLTLLLGPARHAFGISFPGSRNGFLTMVAVRGPSGCSTISSVPMSACTTGSIAYPMFDFNLGECIAEVTRPTGIPRAVMVHFVMLNSIGLPSISMPTSFHFGPSSLMRARAALPMKSPDLSRSTVHPRPTS